MSNKKRSRQKTKITIDDYRKAVRKADREIELANSTGWKRVTSVHDSDRLYNRKKDKKRNWEDE